MFGCFTPSRFPHRLDGGCVGDEGLKRVLPNFTDTSKKPANALALTSGAEVVIIVRCAQLRILIAPWRLAPGSEQGFGGKLLNPME